MIMEAAVLCFSERSDDECLIFFKKKKDPVEESGKLEMNKEMF